MVIDARNLAEFWRKRAEEARAVAVQMNDPMTKAVMLSIAQDYEKLVVRAQQGADDVSPVGNGSTLRHNGSQHNPT